MQLRPSICAEDHAVQFRGESVAIFANAVFDYFEGLKLLHPEVTNTTKELMLVGNAVPFRPGAIRYFSELGLMKKTCGGNSISHWLSARGWRWRR